MCHVETFRKRMHSSRKRTTHAVAISWGICFSACWDTPPWVWTWRTLLPDVAMETPRCGPGDPLGVGMETPLGVGMESPLARLLKLPPGCGPGDQQGMLGYHPLETCKSCWDTTCKACWDTPPMNSMTGRHV